MIRILLEQLSGTRNTKSNALRPTAHRSLLTFLLLTAHCLLLTFLCLPSSANAQVIVDKTVATVNNGTLGTPDLITYSDLIWQLALEPDVPIEQPGTKALTHALETVIDQRLILLEAKKLPGSEPADDQVQARRDELARQMGPAMAQRMTQTGLSSEQLNEILRDRIEIDNYVDFRFRAFVLITDKEVAAYYNEVYGRQRNREPLIPTLEQARKEIVQKLTEEKIASQIDTFIDNLRQHAEIAILNPIDKP